MERRTLLERIGVVATTGVLVGCLDDGAGGDDGSPAASGDGQGGNGDGNSRGNGTGDSNGTGGDGSDDGSATDGGGSDGSDDDPDGEGSDGTGDDGDTDSSHDSSDDESDDELEDGETENGENESVGAEEDSAFSARDGRSSVETTSADCHSDGDDDHGATVEFDEDRLLATGHLEAPDPCHEAVLETATVRDGAVEIEIGLESTGGFCTECVGRIEYEATVEIADGVPDEVVVYHRRSDERIEVATATR